MELLKNLEGLSADEQMTAVVELQKAAMKTLEEQKQASIGKSAELVIQGLKKIKSDFEAKFDSLNYDIQTKVASLKDGEQGLQGPKGDQGERGLDGSNGRDGRDGKDGKDGIDGVDGVGVRDAKIDFDGSLVISLTDGREINCGEVVSVDVAKQIQKVTHNIQTGAGGDSQTVLDAIAAIQATIATYGTMATQNKTSVDIEGGTIDNTTIGATTPSTGVFTTLTATGQTSLGGAADAEALRAVTTASAINWVQVSGATNGNAPSVLAAGANTSVFLDLASKGTAGGVRFKTAVSTEQMRVSHTASAVNYVQVTGAATSGLPVISAQGSDTNIAMYVTSKGNGTIRFATNNSAQTQLRVSHTTSAVNFVDVTGSASGSAPIIGVAGNDSNIDLALTTKGTGALKVNNGRGPVFLASDTGNVPTNYIAVYGNNQSPEIRAEGSSSVLDLQYLSKSTGGHRFFTQGTSYAEQLRVTNTTSAVNYVQVTGAATGAAARISTQGSDSLVGLGVSSKGGGDIFFQTNGSSNTGFIVKGSTTAVNYLQVAGAATGSDPVLSAQGSDTNIDLVLSPKGTGALQAQQTDSTATGGNARGANAVDWQTVRGSANQVAAGGSSVVCGGQNNRAGNAWATVAGGYSHTASGQFSGVLSGYANNATGQSAFVGAGESNTASGYDASIVAGSGNTAAGYFNFIGNGYFNSGTSASAVTTQSATMNGTTAVTLAASNASIKVGQYITGTSIAGDTYVAAVSGTSLTLSKNASGSSTSTLSFYTPHGVVVGGGNNQATGAYSFIGGGGDAGTAGNRNVASGDWSVIAGGRGNSASAVGAFVGGGGFDGATLSANAVSGLSATVAGGMGNSASGYNAVISGGRQNQANSTVGTINGGGYGTSRGITGYTVSPASFSPIGTFLVGTSQAAMLVLAVQTTDATATVLRSDTGAASGTNQVILPNNSAYYFRGEVVSGVTGGGNTKGWTIEGVIKRGANAASTTLVGSTVTSMYADAGAVTWTIALSADTTNGGLAVTFTGQAATTIRTVAQIRTTEMTY